MMRVCSHAFALLALCLVVGPSMAFAGAKRSAELTHIKGDVRVTSGSSAPVTATADSEIDEGSTVETGADSWAELRFNNKGVARVGPNSVFSFHDGSRRMVLRQGSIIMQLPKGAHGGRVEGGGNSAIVAGSTALFEVHPNVFKFLVLEGTVRLYRPGHLGDSVLLPPGRMVIGQPGTALSDPVDFDLARFLKTSHFITDFPALESAPQMARQAGKQDRDKAKGILRSTNLAIFGEGTSVSVLDPSQAPAAPDSNKGGTPPPEKQRDVVAPPIDRIPTSR